MKAGMVLGAALAAPLLGALPAQAQITCTGRRRPPARRLRGSPASAATSPAASAAWAACSIAPTAWPSAPSCGNGQRRQLPRAQSSQPYSLTFGSPNGILRGRHLHPIGGSADRFIWYNATRPDERPILNVPAAPSIAHSQFGNQVVGNFNTTSNMGTIFNYNIATGSFTISVPGASIVGLRHLGGPDVGGFSLGGATPSINQTTGASTTTTRPALA